ncbi:MAG: tetratricopeptide repeat protein [Planctomycetes bacterium]|nr:tetratricopeptide repeat protein [Planctomycetota bacterium]
MQLSQAIATTLAIAYGCAFVGCAGPSPFDTQPMDAFSTAAGFDAPDRQPYDQLAQAFQQQNTLGPSGSRMPVQTPHPNAASGWMSSWQNAGDAVSRAFTITPATTPAADPTSLANQPGDVGGQLNYHAAKVYETQGNVAGAMELYQKSLNMSPNDVRSMIGYARLLDRHGNFREAERYYLRAVELEPNNVVALNDLGMIYARQGMYDEALTPLNQAVLLQPANQRYCNNIAIVLLDADRTDEAFSHLAAVHGDATAHYNLGYLMSRRNRNSEAAGHLQQALAMNPRLTPARQLLDSLAAPAGYVQQGLPPVSRPVYGYPTDANFTIVPHQTPTARPLPPL